MQFTQHTFSLNLMNSPISSFEYNGHTFFVKRDDLLDRQFNGNKARKLFYYLMENLTHINTLISYGGSQSNLMYALSCLAKFKAWDFTYYTRKISEQALTAKNGNLAASLANGMKLVQSDREYNKLSQNPAHYKNQLLITQGSAQPEAEYGIGQLAKEINDWAKQQHFKCIAVIIPSGTGTSAAYLQKHLPNHIVYTTNCIGTKDFLCQQMEKLIDTKHFPTILMNEKFRFATPYQELFDTIQSINEASNIKFDLVYDPIMWHTLLDYITAINLPILYIHCGGIQGNITMLQRYHRYFHEYMIESPYK